MLYGCISNAGITGTSAWLAADSVCGDIEDIAKTLLLDFSCSLTLLEDTLAGVGVDADLFGIDPNTFSEANGLKYYTVLTMLI